tara:strand:- start:59 stop:472 length:414 start_codon:yes stop_codon:yes gene_type:complete
MSIPILLAIVTLVTFGINAFFGKVAAANQAYIPSFMTATSGSLCLLGIVMHLIQKHPFELSKMIALGSLGGIIAGIGFYTMLLAFRMNAEGSIIFPITALSVIVSVPLSIIIFREPLTATRLLGLGLGVGSIILLAR